MTDMQKTGSGRGLAALRILDLGRYIAAPFCAQMLAAEGAEVIRVEPPEGATDREVMSVGIPGRGALYLQVNAGKKSLTLDYSQPEGRAVLEELVRSSDALIVNLPDGALKKLRLDYDTLKALRPDLILTTVSAYAHDGANGAMTGFDGTGQALSGAMYLSGIGDQPWRAAVSYVDYATAMSAAFATMTALYERERTGEGQHVRLSLLGTAMTMMNPMLVEEATGWRRRKPIGNRSPIAGPSDLYRTRDGWVMVQVIGNAMFRRWAEFIGQGELADDPRFKDDSARGENGEVLSAIMGGWCAARDTQTCLAALAAARLPACPCLEPRETLHHPAFRDYVTDLTLPGSEAPVPLVTRAIRTRAQEDRNLPPAPLLGADTEALLLGLGLSPADLAALRARSLV